MDGQMDEETKFVRKYVLTLACVIRNDSLSEDEITNVNVLQRHRTCSGYSIRPLNQVFNYYK